MSTRPASPGPCGFAPLFRNLIRPADARLDAERQAAADRLAGHFADGRLDQAEFDERAGLAMSAKTQADLSALFTDLPETGAPAGPQLPPRRHHRPVLSLVLIVVIVWRPPTRCCLPGRGYG